MSQVRCGMEHSLALIEGSDGYSFVLGESSWEEGGYEDDSSSWVQRFIRIFQSANISKLFIRKLLNSLLLNRSLLSVLKHKLSLLSIMQKPLWNKALSVSKTQLRTLIPSRRKCVVPVILSNTLCRDYPNMILSTKYNPKLLSTANGLYSGNKEVYLHLLLATLLIPPSTFHDNPC